MSAPWWAGGAGGAMSSCQAPLSALQDQVKSLRLGSFSHWQHRLACCTPGTEDRRHRGHFKDVGSSEYFPLLRLLSPPPSLDKHLPRPAYLTSSHWHGEEITESRYFQGKKQWEVFKKSEPWLERNNEPHPHPVSPRTINKRTWWYLDLIVLPKNTLWFRKP